MKSASNYVQDTLRIVAGVVVYFSWAAMPFARHATEANLVGLIALAGIAATIGAIYIFLDWLLVQRKRERLAGKRAIFATALAGATVASALGIVLQAGFVYSGLVPISSLSEEHTSRIEHWLQLLDGLAVSPFIEEILFRAWLLGSLWGAGSLKLRLAISCLVFPFGHLSFDPVQEQLLFIPLVSFLMVLNLGLILTVIWLRTRSLLACFVAHSLYNAVPTLGWWIEG